MRRCLVVASQTFGGERLYEEIRRRVRGGPCRFHVVVPASTSREPADARPAAERRLHAVLSRLHGMGILAAGEVTGADPEPAVAAALTRERFDEVILPTGTARSLTA